MNIVPTFISVSCVERMSSFIWNDSPGALQVFNTAGHPTEDYVTLLEGGHIIKMYLP